MDFIFKNGVQFSCDFGKVVPSGTTQRKVCQGHNYFFRTNLIGIIQGFIFYPYNKYFQHDIKLFN
jgi:hypothetical protein